LRVAVQPADQFRDWLLRRVHEVRA